MTRTFFGHPRGLAILFGTEMWERMSFYGMRALLVAYLVKYLFLPGHVEQVLFYPQIKAAIEALMGPQSPQSLASLIYGSYVGFIYLTPLLGGWLADSVLGQRRTALLGMVVMAFGHFAMAAEALLFPALLLLIFGGGLFKSNTTAQVGLLYKPGDPARDAGYAIFYIGINLGAFLAPFICGTLGETVGWHYGFAAAGVGILLGVAIYLFGWRDLPPEPVRAKAERSPRAPLTQAEWKSIAALLVLVFPLSLYWACNEQWGNTMALWSIDNTDRSIRFFAWHGEIPWTWFQALNPFVIFFGTPLVLALWRWQGAREPSNTMKMAWGCHLMTASNLLMIVPAWQSGKASWLWLAAYFLILSVGEIYLYPVSLSLFSKVAPRRLASLMAGIVFLPNFLGAGFLQGWLGTFWDKMDKAVFFAMIAAISALAGLIIWIMDRPLRSYLEEQRP